MHYLKRVKYIQMMLNQVVNNEIGTAGYLLLG